MIRIIRPLTLFCLLVACLAASRASQLPTEPILRLDPGRHIGKIGGIDTDRAGRWLVSASYDKTVRVWDASTGRLERVLRPPIGEGDEGKLISVAISPDGRLVACGGLTRLRGIQGNNIYLFLRADGRLVGRAGNLPYAIDHLAFSPDGRKLAATMAEDGMKLFAVGNGSPALGSGAATVLSLIAEDRTYGDYSYGAHFSPDGRWLVTSSLDGYLRLYDIGAINQASMSSTVMSASVSQKAHGGSHPYAVKFSPDGSKVAVGFEDSTAVDVLSARDLQLLYSPLTTEASGSLPAIAWSTDGRFLFAAGGYQRKSPADGGWRCVVRQWVTSGQLVPTDLATGAVSTIMDLAALPDGSLAIGASDPVLLTLGNDGKEKWVVGSSNADFRESDFRLSEDGSVVAFAYKVFGVAPASFSLADRSLTLSVDRSLIPPRTSAPGLNIQGWNNTAIPTLNGEGLALEQYERSLSLAIAPDAQSFLIGADWHLWRFGHDGKTVWSIAAPETAWRVNIAGNGRVAAAAFADGSIRWYRYSDGKELAAFFPHADQKRWVLWTPSGYYDASPGAEELIGWHVNNGPDKEADFFPVSRFRNLKYRPDVISKVLGTLDEAEAVRLADAERGKAPEKATIAEVLPPVISITAPESGSEVSVTNVTLRYAVRTPGGQPVTGVRALVDGRPVALNRSVKLAVKEGEEQTTSITIPERDCEVSLIAENRFGASVPATVRLTWASAPKPGEFVAKPKLYLLAVGVSAYQKPELKLNYAAKDARDFAAAMQSQKGGLYRDVEVKLLSDATKEDIEDGLDWLEHQVTSRDYGMIFLAGHGVDDPNGTYYFLPANADLARLKRTCLVFSDIKTTLNSIAGKAVMFIDTCHSGDVMGARRGVADINGLVNELASAENGVVVFCASTGRQYSLEDPQWQNGAFTKALVEGMNGKADYGRKGKITINMLDLYLSERVKELTQGRQTPATTKPNTVPDFPLAQRQ